MKITACDVTHVADLASLEVPEEEKETLAGQLSRIVGYVDKLNEIDTDGVEPTTWIVRGRVHPARPDEVSPRDGSGEAGRTVRFFDVPRVISGK